MGTTTDPAPPISRAYAHSSVQPSEPKVTMVWSSTDGVNAVSGMVDSSPDGQAELARVLQSFINSARHGNQLHISVFPYTG